MEHIISTNVISVATLGATITGMVQIAKILGCPKKLLPVLSIVLGIGLGFVMTDFQFSGAVILEGTIAGLTAVGLFSGIKNTRQGIRGLKK